MAPIRFFSPRGRYCELSNFYICAFRDTDGTFFDSVERFFMKRKQEHLDPENTTVGVQIMRAHGPIECKQLGRRLRYNTSWEDVREAVMREGVYHKFSQNPVLRDLLLSTHPHDLIEASPYDAFWGEGALGTGRNRLGVILVDTRKRLWRAK